MINKEHVDSFDCIQENLNLELAERFNDKPSENDSVEHKDETFVCFQENLKLELAESFEKNRASGNDSVEDHKHQQMINKRAC